MKNKFNFLFQFLFYLSFSGFSFPSFEFLKLELEGVSSYLCIFTSLFLERKRIFFEMQKKWSRKCGTGERERDYLNFWLC